MRLVDSYNSVSSWLQEHTSTVQGGWSGGGDTIASKQSLVCIASQ